MENTAPRRILYLVFFTNYCQNNKINGDNVGNTRISHGGGRHMHIKCYPGRRKETDPLGDRNIDGKIILKCI
jgi:hypothetical protein